VPVTKIGRCPKFYKPFDPLHKYGTGKARNLKFGIRIDLGKSHLTDEKYLHKERGQGQGPNFLNFGTSP